MKIVCERCSRATKAIGSPKKDNEFGGIRRTHKCKDAKCGHRFETHEGSRSAALTLALKLANKHFGARLAEFDKLLDELRALLNLSKN